MFTSALCALPLSILLSKAGSARRAQPTRWGRGACVRSAGGPARARLPAPPRSPRARLPAPPPHGPASTQVPAGVLGGVAGLEVGCGRRAPRSPCLNCRMATLPSPQSLRTLSWRGRNCEETGALTRCRWNSKMVRTRWRRIRQQLFNLRRQLPFDPEIPLLRMYYSDEKK